MRKYLMIIGSLTAIFWACQQGNGKKDSDNHLGSLGYTFVGSEAAQPHFVEGMLLLHSFEYTDARESFVAAREADSSMVMAYWGEAMTYYKALWGLQDEEGGREALNRLAPTPEERAAYAKDDLERGFLRGAEILYGEGTLDERNKAYAEHMGKLYEQYPDNQEVAAFYALGLMWSSPEGRDPEVFDRSSRVAAGILDENPLHPGALHYMIHANDDPEYARYAQKAADAYAKVAPDATHALHMPSHIYLALGMWPEVVSSNEASYAASLKRMEAKGLDGKARSYHAYDWLFYGYLQQERFDDAERMLREMEQFVEEVGNKNVRSYWVHMRPTFLHETDDWATGVDFMPADLEGLSIRSVSQDRFFVGAMAYRNDDQSLLDAMIDSLAKEIQAASLIAQGGQISVCSAGPTRYRPTKNNVNQARVMLMELKAFRSLLTGDESSAEKHLLQATKIEGECEYSFGPPDIPAPSFEIYGTWLLQKGRAQEALAQFETSLTRAPGRTKALRGKMTALKALGRMEEAQKVQRDLDQGRRQNRTRQA